MTRLLIIVSVVGLAGCVDESAQRAKLLEAKQQYIAELRNTQAEIEALLPQELRESKDKFCSLIESPSAKSLFVDKMQEGSSKSKAEAEKEVDLIIECICHDFFGQIIRGVEGGYLVKGMPMPAIEFVIGSRNRVKQAEWPNGTVLYEVQGDSVINEGRFQEVYYTLWMKDGMLRDWTKHYRSP